MIEALDDSELLELYTLITEHIKYLESSIIVNSEEGDEDDGGSDDEDWMF